MTTFEDIVKRAEALGLPITEDEFKGTKQNPVPDPPFIVYLHTEALSGSDDKNRVKEIDGSIELYTDRKRDKGIEQRIEDEVLFDVHYNMFSAYIDSENMNQTAYEFTFKQKL